MIRYYFKFLLLFVFNFCTGLYCFPQADTIQKCNSTIGLNLGASVSPDTRGLNYFADLTCERGKSFFALGPVIGPKSKPNLYFYGHSTVNGQYRLNGFHSVYQINPNIRGKRFDFFFQYEFIYLRYFDKGQATVNYPLPPHSIDYKYTDQFIENYIGYGFRVKFLKQFSLAQSFGIGVIQNTVLLNGNYMDGYTGFSGNVKLVLGFAYWRNKYFL